MIRSENQTRPVAVRFLGWFFVIASTALFLGGALREQSNMINSGLLFLSFGLIFAPDLLQRGWSLRLGVAALACFGMVLALIY